MNAEPEGIHGLTIEDCDGHWSISGCQSREDAVRRLEDLAERDGEKFRQYWWKLLAKSNREKDEPLVSDEQWTEFVAALERQKNDEPRLVLRDAKGVVMAEMYIGSP